MTERKLNKVFLELAEDLNNTARRVLGRRTIGKNKTYGESSGNLRRSLTFNVVSKGGRESIEFGSPLPYAPFIHWGVNGTDKNRGSQYSYKDKQPPIHAVRKWMKAKPIRLRDKDGAFIKQTESRLNSAAFNIARAIKKNGIPGLFYYSKAYTEVIPKWNDKIGGAVVADFLERLQARVDNIVIKS